MPRIVLLVSLLLLLGGCSDNPGSSAVSEPRAVTATDPTAPGGPVILVVGDSLSAGYGMDVESGWVWLLQQRLEKRGYPYRVVNASQSGATSSSGLALLDRALSRNRPRLVVIELGANDGLRGLPLPQLRDNLESMIDKSQAAGARVLLVAIRIPTNYGARYTEDFRAIFPELAQQTGAALVPEFIERVALQPRLMQLDRVHPNERAQPLLLDAVWEHLEPLLSKTR